MAESKSEVKGFYYCGHGRCPVRYWPVEQGELCPVCGQSGGFAGFVVKQPTLAIPTDDEE